MARMERERNKAEAGWSECRDFAQRMVDERDEARGLAKWFYRRLKQVCLDNLLEESVGGILARLEEAVLDDPWLEEAVK